MTPLALACEAGSTDVVKLLLKARADANQALRNGETPLMMAARTGRVPIMKLLLAQGAKVDARERYHVQMLTYLRKKLSDITEGEGSLLDHSLILYGSNMGNSNQHLHYDVPHVLVGGASGQLQGDRQLTYASRSVPTGNLLLSILDKFKVGVDRFGDSTGRLEGI